MFQKAQYSDIPDQQESYYAIALDMISGIGPATCRKLIDHFGSARAVFEASMQELTRVSDIGEITGGAIRAFRDFRKVEKEIAFMNREGIRILPITHPDYPQRLLNCNDPPIVLFCRGDVCFNTPRVLAVVGTRSMTDYGREVCSRLIHWLKPYDPLIISGLAYGVDALAHRESLALGLKTVGVLGHGPDTIYPSINRGLASKMLSSGGGLVTEFLSNTIPEKTNFPKRNRIIAGMSDAVIVVEAARKGGALVTAKLANGYHRHVMAFPGRINDPFSGGCNYLVKSHLAHLIIEPEDIENTLGWNIPGRESLQQGSQLEMVLGDPDEQAVVDLLKRYPRRGIDAIIRGTGIPSQKLSLIMLELEIRGVISRLPGGRFTLQTAYDPGFQICDDSPEPSA